MKMAIGIDVHKEKSTAYAVYAGTSRPDPGQRAVLEEINKDFRRFPSDSGGYGRLANRIGDHEVQVLIENSTKSHEVYWMLRHLGIPVTVANSTDLYQITKSVDKTDDNDAMRLADCMRRKILGEVEFSESCIPEPKALMQRELCRMAIGIRSEISVAKQRIRSYMLICGTKLSQEFNDIGSVQALKELEQTGIVIFELEAKRLRELKKSLYDLEDIIRKEMKDNEIFQIIWSIPGFGVLSSAYMSCILTDISRFDDARSLAASVGLTPKLDMSTDKYKKTPITHRGDADLRKLVYQATFVHVSRFDSHISDKYHRLRANGKHHNTALVACANSMCKMIFAMVRDRTMFEADPSALAELRAIADSDNIENEMENFAETC